MENRDLASACFYRDLNSVLQFLGRGDNPNGEPLVQAVLQGDMIIMRHILSYWVKVTPCEIYLSEMRHGTFSEQTTFLKSSRWLSSLSGM